MNPARQQTLQYLRAPLTSIWQWAEDGQVIVWSDDTTVAFREEIPHILATLAPRGLPSFGAIVFLLAACRGKIPTTSEVLQLSPKHAPPHPSTPPESFPTRLQLAAQVESDLAELHKIAALPADLRSNLRARCLLAEAAFEFATSERHVDAPAILSILSDPTQPLNGEAFRDDEAVATGGTFQRQIHLIASGLRNHTQDTLALRLRTGLDSIPDASPVGLSAADQARSLIAELHQDRDHAPLARACREILAAIRLPRQPGIPENPPLGGVADITNRGPLDRLLLSELAHDDLTLAVRIALHEALYLRREPSVRVPEGALALLLDSGIRLWGIPRLLATATALALIARNPANVRATAWRAHGNRVEPVDLLRRAGLVGHLAALNTEAHPGQALDAFDLAARGDSECQQVLITHADTLEDPTFRQLLLTRSVSPRFVATVDQTGRFELHALPLSRRPPLCSATLDLDAIFTAPPRIPLLLRNDPADDTPAALRALPFPFLLPVQDPIQAWCETTSGNTFAMLQNQSMVRFRRFSVGCEFLAHGLPATSTLWMECLDDTVHLVTATSPSQPARLISIPASGGTPHVVDLVRGADVLAVHQIGDVLLLIREHDLRAHSLADGRLLGRSPNPHTWSCGRFLRGDDHFHAVSWDGSAVRVDPVPDFPSGSASPISKIFDRPGLDGPWIVRENGDVESLTLGHVASLRLGEACLGPCTPTFRISRSGNRIATDSIPEGPHLLLDLDARAVTQANDAEELRRILDRPPCVPERHLLRSLTAIARTPEGFRIQLESGRWMSLGISRRNGLRIEDAPEPPHEILRRSFAEIIPRPELGCTLSVARWPSGSSVFFDDRGMLHFRSHLNALPEISLVLEQKDAVAAWTSDGATCGPPFFFRGDPEPDLQNVVTACNSLATHL